MKFFREILISLAVLLYVFAFYPIVYDESYDSFCNMQVAHQFSDFALMDQYYLAWVGFNEIYKFLHDMFSLVNWAGMAFLAFNFIGLVFLLYSLKKLLKQKNLNQNIIFLFQLFIALVYIDNFISITHTRFAILFCGLSVLNLGLIKKISNRFLVVNLLLFITGMLHRPETAIGLILLGFAVIFVVRKLDALFQLKKLFLPILATSTLFFIFFIDWHNTDRFEKKMEPDIEYALTTGRFLPLDSMKNTEDSLRHTMASKGIFIDEDFVNIEFLKKITSVQTSISFNKLIYSIKEVGSFYYHFIYFPVLFIAGCILLFFLNSNLSRSLNFILINVIFYLFMTAIAYSSGLSNRHVSGLLLLNTFLNTYLLSIPIKRLYYLNKGFLIFFIIVYSGSLLTIVNFKSNYKQVYDEVLCFNEVIRNFENFFEDEIVVITMDAYHFFDRPFFFINQKFDKNTYLIYDMLYFSKVPPYNDYLAKLCNCNPKNPKEFFKWLEEQEAFYVAGIERYKITEKYMNTVHDFNFSFKEGILNKDIIKPSCIENSIYKDYNFKRLTFNTLNAEG